MKKYLFLLVVIAGGLGYFSMNGMNFSGLTGSVTADLPDTANAPLENSFKLASFNIQTLGKSKVEKPLAQEYLPKIIQQFDVIAIQELRDASDTTITALQEWLPNYRFHVGERLGRTNSKEQYVIAYRAGEVIGSYVYNDVDDDFEREPQISYMRVGNNSFSLINVHIKPDDAENEIDYLDLVIEDAQNHFNDNDFILVGDLNADCNYYDETQPDLTQFTWVIDDEQDTTVAKNTCTYDRIITNMQHGQAGVFNYEQEYSLSWDDAKVISDHFPVWGEFSTS